LDEQSKYIFVSQQIADEVARNKLKEAKDYFSNQLAAVSSTVVPDHLFGLSDKETEEIRETLNQAKEASAKLRKLATRALGLISRSEDEVSTQLERLFRGAVRATEAELQRAKERKERGNPPGKPNSPLGDEIVWEQLLAHCGSQKVERVWIVTRDRDYCTEIEKKLLVLNPMLYHELKRIGVSEIRCFGDLLVASEDFAKNAGVTAKTLPTEKESEEIRKEIEGLSRLPFVQTDDSWMMRANNALRLKALIAATAGASALFGEVQDLGDPQATQRSG
jgi:hypothetical protein